MPPISLNQVVDVIPDIPPLFRETGHNHRYIEDSEFHSYAKGITIELIKDPARKLMRAGMFEQVIDELRDVVLAAFEKPFSEHEKYAPQHTMSKNVIWVDWLAVARRNNRPVAFSAATFIQPDLLYLNSAMVIPEEKATQIGAMINPLLWKNIFDFQQSHGLTEFQLVCRTHNRDVVSGLLHAFLNGRISTETNLDSRTIATFSHVAKYLECTLDSYGVSRDVYPEGLPSGHVTNRKRVTEAFRNVGERDACYLLGYLNYKYVEQVCRHYNRENNSMPEPLMQGMPAAMPAYA